MKLSYIPEEMTVRFKSLAVILFIILAQAGCATYEMNSLWKTDEINIDGKISDWVGKLSYIEDAHVSVGVQNDQESLYICLIAEHQSLSVQVMSQGMTLWFDPSGGRNKSFGIRFPLGRQFSGERGNPMSMPREGMDREKRVAEFKPSLNELEILYPEGEKSIKISKNEAKGIDVALTPSVGVLVYELKVPLHQSESQPYAIGIKAEKMIGIGMEVPKMDKSAMRDAGRGGMGRGPGGGMVPAGGGRGGGIRGGGGMGRGPGMMNGLKIWAATKLALETITPPSN